MEAETKSLREVLTKERASFDEYSKLVATLSDDIENERKKSDERIKSLEGTIKKMRTQQYIPGIIGGGAIKSDSFEGVIGVGWKLNLW